MNKGGRYYEDMNPIEAGSTILSDIVHTGRSIGWISKESETLGTMKEVLRPYNVQYVSDFEGRWELRSPEKEEISKDKKSER